MLTAYAYVCFLNTEHVHICLHTQYPVGAPWWYHVGVTCRSTRAFGYSGAPTGYWLVPIRFVATLHIFWQIVYILGIPAGCVILHTYVYVDRICIRMYYGYWTHEYMCPYIHAHMHTHIYTCMHTYIQACTRASIYTCIHTCIRTCIHTHIHTYIHTYINTYIHTYMHTNKNTRSPYAGFLDVWCAATHCNTLQNTATHCNSLQHPAGRHNAGRRGTGRVRHVSRDKRGKYILLHPTFGLTLWRNIPIHTFVVHMHTNISINIMHNSI